MKSFLNFSKEIDAAIGLAGAILCWLFADFVKNIFGINWFDKILKILPFLFTILFLIQYQTFKKLINEFDYIVFARKTLVTIIVSLVIFCIINLFYINQIIDFANRQNSFKIKKEITLEIEKKLHGKSYMSFILNKTKETILIGNQEALKLKKEKPFDKVYCIELELKKGIDSTLILVKYKLEYCE